MKEKIFLILIPVFLVFLSSCKDKNKEALNEPLTCDLNLQDCTYKFKGKEVLISLNPKPLQALDITYLKVKNLGDYENLKLKIYGLTMFMGELKPKLTKLENGNYESKIVLSSCTLDTMRFRAEFIQNEKPIGFYFDFELKR